MAQNDLPAIELEPADDAPPLIGNVRAYWAAKSGARAMPSRDQIRPAEIKAWLPHILLADVIAGGADFRYRLVGTKIALDFRTPPTGRLVSEMIAPFGPHTVTETLRAYRRVVERAAPLRIRGSGAWYAQGAKTFDAILMPLSDDGKAVAMILGAFLFTWDEARRPAPVSLLAAR